MFKAKIINQAAAANTNIPLAVVWNTNNNTAYNSTDNDIEILTAGYYNINVILTVTGSAAATVTAQLIADGTALPESVVTSEITATTGVASLVITDTIKVSSTVAASIAQIAVQMTGAATVTNGVVTVEKVR